MNKTQYVTKLVQHGPSELLIAGLTCKPAKVYSWLPPWDTKGIGSDN